MANILIIDDEQAIRAALKDILEHEQHTVEEAADGAAGVAAAKKGAFDLVLCDIKMPKMDGLEVLEKLQAFNDELPVVMIGGHGTIDTAGGRLEEGRLRLHPEAARPQPDPDQRAQRAGPWRPGEGDPGAAPEGAEDQGGSMP